MPSLKTQRICPAGHRYYKGSDCPVCPVCEEQRQAASGLLSGLSAPARRALETAGITKVNDLATYTEKEILKLHGLGKASLPWLLRVLSEHNLAFKH